MSASSSFPSSVLESAPPLIRHDVFISFRGEDTRDNFVSHLRAELQRKKIETYMDDRTLGRGEEISPALYKAIEESMVYVIVFSESYASSTWCLGELTKILDCRKRYGRDVIPVFYKVDPSTVRKQKETYAEAFDEHKDRFKDQVHAWKEALTDAAGLSGWDSHVTRPEDKLVVEIVKDILRKLNRYSISGHEGIIGIESHIARIQSLLQLESPAIRIIGIWGMGGIGKTTIATQIYHKLAVQFDSSSLVLNCQKEIERNVGVDKIRNKYLIELLEEDSRYSKERLKRTKVLLVLDDVNNSGQLEDLIGRRGDFGRGSRIIVTSRDMQVLKNAEADEKYQVKEMSFEDSLQLFSLHAFKQNHPVEAYMDLSVRVLNYAKGIPLALKVLGSLLHDRSSEAWENELQKLERLPDIEIFNVLKLSYDGLDEEQRDIFLDIACFYRGLEEVALEKMLDRCGFSAIIGMDILKDRCLISVLEGRIVMHDLIQEMGHEIVHRQCRNNPGKRSRLWKHEEIYQLLKKNKGTDAIQCILLDICNINKVELLATTFEEMENLRMLHFYKSSQYFRWSESNVFLPSSLESLPDGLKFLHWDDFPQRNLPPNFCPENLVTLEMPCCHLEHLWEPNQHLPNLKRLDLSHSRKLSLIPDLCLSPNIEEIILSDCVRLVQVYSSKLLSKLNSLCLDGCVELRSLTVPSNILSTSSGLILLSNCRKLETFSISLCQILLVYNMHPPALLANTINLAHHRDRRGNRLPVRLCLAFQLGENKEEEDAEATISAWIEGASSRSPSLNKLCWLDLSNCESLTSLLPFEFDISVLKTLKRLDLRGCSKFKHFPEIMSRMENLVVLILNQTAIQELPSSLCQLVGLEELSLCRCSSLEIIPSSIGTLSKLCKLDLTCCESLQTFPSSIFKLKLTKLDLYDCSMLRTFPEILEPAESFAHVNLTKTAIKELPSSFDNLVGLRTLRLNMCTDLESLPNSIVNLNLLEELDCSGCLKLSEIPSDIGSLSLLRDLSLHESGIVNLPESIAHLSSLKSLDLSDCKRLECIPQLPPFLKQLLAFDCPSIKRVMPISNIQIPSNSKEAATFKFHFTNSQQLDPCARDEIVNDAWHRITQDDAYRSVHFSFPGSVIPHWFPNRGMGYSVTINMDSLNLRNDNRLIGFALCVIFGLIDMDNTEGSRYGSFSYRLKYKYNGRRYSLPDHDELRNHFYWKGQRRTVDQDHTLLWKYNLEPASIRLMLCNARSFTFQMIHYDYGYGEFKNFKPNIIVKECGVCPLYTKEKDNNNADAGDNSSFSRFQKNDIEEPSGSKSCIVQHSERIIPE